MVVSKFSPIYIGKSCTDHVRNSYRRLNFAHIPLGELNYLKSFTMTNLTRLRLMLVDLSSSMKKKKI